MYIKYNVCGKSKMMIRSRCHSKMNNLACQRMEVYRTAIEIGNGNLCLSIDKHKVAGSIFDWTIVRNELSLDLLGVF